MNEAVRERDTAIKDKEPAVFLHAIERRYHQGAVTLEILKGAELAVWSGQSVALIAPSGVGKSTLLHIAGLLEHPDGVRHRQHMTPGSHRRRPLDGHERGQVAHVHAGIEPPTMRSASSPAPSVS